MRRQMRADGMVRVPMRSGLAEEGPDQAGLGAIGVK